MMELQPRHRARSINAKCAMLAATLLAVALAMATGCAGSPRDEPVVSGGDPPGLDARLVELGRPIYAANCASCHGASGEGAADWKIRGSDGALPPPPHDATGHTWHHADGLLFRIIRDGCAAYGAEGAPCNMPAFGAELDDEEIRAVIEFMRTWWGPDERGYQEEVTRNDPFP